MSAHRGQSGFMARTLAPVQVGKSVQKAVVSNAQTRFGGQRMPAVASGCQQESNDLCDPYALALVVVDLTLDLGRVGRTGRSAERLTLGRWYPRDR